MKVRRFIPLVDKDTIVTICYAGNGHRLYQGLLSEIPEKLNHIKDYYVTYIIPSGYKLYIEAHESDTFAELPKE